MKMTIIVIVTMMIGFGGGYLLFNHAKPISTVDAAKALQQYTCGMHPEIISDEPGYCPLCGMKLTPKKTGNGLAEGAIMIDPATTQNMGLVTVPVKREEITRDIKAFGKLDYSEPMIRTVNIKIPGWVEKLYVDYEGEFVKNGQALFELYSPELLAAQREYLVAVKKNGKLNSVDISSTSYNLLNAAKSRLKNWDISESQIEALVSHNDLTRTLTFYSPYSGVITAKHINLGDHLNAGMTAYQIADISKLWVKAFVYEQDLPFLNVGQIAKVSIPSQPGRTYPASINYISPYLNDNHQAEIRLDVDNPDYLLKPGIYVEVSFKSSLPGKRMVVPDKAIINSGVKQVVYTSGSDGSFKPNIIQTGAYGSDGIVEVISGLQVNDLVVTSGQFLLDSESRLNESLMMAQAHGGHGHGGSTDDMKKDAMPDNNDHEHGKDKITSNTEDTLSGIYTCPMPEHYHVLQYGEGKCPECGMVLVPVEHTDNTNVYYCPMSECEVVQDQPGNCPVCGMKLKKLESGTNDD